MPKVKIYVGEKLTEEAKAACEALQINQKFLKPRNFESFKEKGLAEELQRIRYEHYEDRRNQLIWQIDNAMKAMHSSSPTHQAILTNSISKYTDAFTKGTKSVSQKPDIALRVPIDREEIVQKQKAKSIYNEEKMALVRENKEKLHQEEEEKLLKKIKDKTKRDKIIKEVQQLEEKKRIERKKKEEAKRATVEQNRKERLKKIERDNKQRYKSMTKKNTYQSEERDKLIKERLSTIRRMEEQEEDDVDSKLGHYQEKMAKAEEKKQNFISSKLSNTMVHLQRVQEKKENLNMSNDLAVQSKHMRSLTEKYGRSKRIEKDKEAKKSDIHIKQLSKQERAHNNMIVKAREEKERIRYLKKKMFEKEMSGQAPPVNYYRQKVKETIDFENEQRKEIQKLKRQDHYENYKVREHKLQNIYKQRLINKLMEKRQRADKIKQQQNRIMSFVSMSKNSSL
ncbi:unnamed protein product [Moneuplotes crassus]|uniref:Uncharacterized protein n=1 Tax=Euplotes crassus TaxID=5936 RepID=A0AAD1X8A9_EUPCR|nr:unnamed protein product [Moneuplotes crassus]